MTCSKHVGCPTVNVKALNDMNVVSYGNKLGQLLKNNMLFGFTWSGNNEITLGCQLHVDRCQRLALAFICILGCRFSNRCLKVKLVKHKYSKTFFEKWDVYRNYQSNMRNIKVNQSYDAVDESQLIKVDLT